MSTGFLTGRTSSIIVFASVRRYDETSVGAPSSSREKETLILLFDIMAPPSIRLVRSLVARSCMSARSDRRAYVEAEDVSGDFLSSVRRCDLVVRYRVAIDDCLSIGITELGA